MRIPVAFGWLLLVGAIPALACSSSPGGAGGSGGSGGSGGTSGSGGTAGSGGSGGSGGTAGNRGIMGGDGGPVTEDLNPYGVSYPTNNQGTVARKGTIAGNQIGNFSFLGYTNATQGSATVDSTAPVSISLSKFYDPLNKTYKLLHISVAAEWCDPCNEETDEVVKDAKTLGGEGVVLVQLLTEGYTMGTGAVTNDLKTWISNKGIDYNMALDPEGLNLGAFFTEAAIPWNADIDVRTMELLDSGVGYDGNEEATINTWVQWVEHNPPSYACPEGEMLQGDSCIAK